MKRIICSMIALVLLISLTACSYIQEHRMHDDIITTASTSANDDTVLKYLLDEYDMKFKLWCPEGHDLYAVHVYPDFAERECHILMPANTDDVDEYYKDLSWKIEGDHLILTGAWEETFQIDIAEGTATSTESGKIYTIYEMDPPLE